jgi:hypothetical protein
VRTGGTLNNGKCRNVVFLRVKDDCQWAIFRLLYALPFKAEVDEDEVDKDEVNKDEVDKDEVDNDDCQWAILRLL